ncbi:flagellar motor switch protein FliM [Heyndrickxia oleronia]|jgi:flagellar motor switch protein FliM|uniref:flagellar motor switch protein FliM n=1 Tax=Heyndrickxia oleronia TaxID=38875 RepID=UPI0009044525|nr:flagellar motor switch protein FliM [Heyndrickxia oleronia]MBU5211122.1 flagellar motor switch protein FliM [Heyndrickxia oleronia]MCM3454174.1 flagellar motor switch protein FliM [Heyndrickxia oleronia]NYV67050.1 flagellar motor switch protein FliM [Bacillus sp. Gen3]OJH18060.1 flagellar motor switch protein FliM [Bacillus obstructivus]
MSGEILSQSEIDALLSALSTGEMNADDIKKEQETKKVKVYDFKRALRFSKDQIRSLTRIHENFARLLTTYFSAQLRTYVQITVASADQIPFEEFIRSVPKMTILNSFDVPPLDGRILMEINPNIAYSMLDLVMGGKGTSVNKVDNLTEIEQRIMSNLFESAFEHLTEAWGNIAEINPVLADFEVNPQFLQMVSPNETVVVISMNTTVGEISGMINLCIPHVVLEPIIPNLSVHYWMQNNNKEKEPIEAENIEKRIKHAPIPLAVELGNAEISIEDFLSIQMGDVIQLDKKIDEPVVVKLEGIPKYYAQVGKSSKKMAIQILNEVKGGDDDE